MADLIVRPAPNGSNSGSTDIFKVYLAPEYILRYNLRPGEICDLEKGGLPVGSVLIDRSPDKSLRVSVIQISQALQTLYKLKLGDKVSLRHKKEDLPTATTVTFIEIDQASGDGLSSMIDGDERAHWSWVLGKVLKKSSVIAPGMSFSNVEVVGETRSFKILAVEESKITQLYQLSQACLVKFGSIDIQSTNENRNHLHLPVDDIGGLNGQLARLNNIIHEYSSQEGTANWRDGEPPRPPGVLLYGISGTGKSLLLHKIAQAGWRKVYHLDRRTVNQTPQQFAVSIGNIFAEAKSHQPCAVLMDNLESIAPNQASQPALIVKDLAFEIRREIDKLRGSPVLVVAASRTLGDIDQSLRSPFYFSEEIEITIPNLKARAQILQILSGFSKHAVDAKYEYVASQTHGFVGLDLLRLYHAAGEQAKSRIKVEQEARVNDFTVNDEEIRERSKSDYENVLRYVRPTAMREVFVETPQVQWRDIGGQGKVKQYLEEAIIWPHKFPDELKEYGIEQTNGLLLYGPPGCSKTMTAKAVATESGLNFIAVKGAELLNMYVGETERAIRELFAKARAVSPSIIFFDEIDAIGASRNTGQHSGVHTVTTLLNELDGISEFKGVFVLAATNQPEALDAALIRPGRLDSMIYVGPPDRDARKYILKQRARNLKLENDVDLSSVAGLTQGRSGAEIVALCQCAAKLAFRERKKLTQEHFLAAVKQVAMQITPQMEESYKAFAASRGSRLGF